MMRSLLVGILIAVCLSSSIGFLMAMLMVEGIRSIGGSL